jgi:hypothetical protein
LGHGLSGLRVASQTVIPLMGGGGLQAVLEASSDSLLAQSAGQAGKRNGNAAGLLPLPSVEYWPLEPVTPVTVTVTAIAGDSGCAYSAWSYASVQSPGPVPPMLESRTFLIRPGNITVTVAVTVAVTAPG